jgi:hypothetical protein
MGRLGTKSAFDVLARARTLESSGRKVIHFEIGEPDFNTPQHIVEAAMEALRSVRPLVIDARRSDRRPQADDRTRTVTVPPVQQGSPRLGRR